MPQTKRGTCCADSAVASRFRHSFSAASFSQSAIPPSPSGLHVQDLFHASSVLLAVQQPEPVLQGALNKQVNYLALPFAGMGAVFYLQLVLGLCKQLLGQISPGFRSLQLLLQICTGRKAQRQHTAVVHLQLHLQTMHGAVVQEVPSAHQTAAWPCFSWSVGRWLCRAIKGLCSLQRQMRPGHEMQRWHETGF